MRSPLMPLSVITLTKCTFLTLSHQRLSMDLNSLTLGLLNRQRRQVAQRQLVYDAVNEHARTRA